MIPPNAKKNHGIFQKQLRPDIASTLLTTYLSLSTVWQWRVICYYRICQLRPRNRKEYLLICFCLCLAVGLCIKMSSWNIVLMMLLQIEAKDLTVTHPLWHMKYSRALTKILHLKYKPMKSWQNNFFPFHPVTERQFQKSGQLHWIRPEEKLFTELVRDELKVAIFQGLISSHLVTSVSCLIIFLGVTIARQSCNLLGRDEAYAVKYIHLPKAEGYIWPGNQV